MDLASVITTAGSKNQKTLQSIDNSLKAILATERATKSFMTAQQRRDAQDKARAAADRKVQVNANKGIIDKLDRIINHVDEVEEKLNNIENGNKNSGNPLGGIPKGTLATAAAAVVTATGVMSGGARAVTEVQRGIGNNLGGQGQATFDKPNNGEEDRKDFTYTFENIADKLFTMRAMRDMGTPKTEEEMEMLKQNIAVLEELANRMRQTKSLNDQLYDAKQRNDTDAIKELTINLEQSRKIQAEILSRTNLRAETIDRETLRNRGLDNSIMRFFARQEDKDRRLELIEQGYWNSTYDDLIQGRQTGGPVKVPGTGSGDTVPAMLQPGSFVLNRNASKFLFRQKGGKVPVMLEPGESVFAPGMWDRSIETLNSGIPRFQEGGQVDGNFIFPLSKGRTGTSPAQLFGAPRDGGSRRHAGIDLVETTPYGSDPRLPVLAAKNGVVLPEKYQSSGYTGGLMIRQNDGYDSRYVHITPEVQPGTQVRAGDRVGRLNSLGESGSNSHLHFELYRRNSGSALDPTTYLQSAGKTVGPGNTVPGMQNAPDGQQGQESGPGRGQAAEMAKLLGPLAGLFSITGTLGGILGDLDNMGLSGLAAAIGATNNPEVSTGVDTGQVSSVGSGNKADPVQVGRNLMADMGISKQAAAGIVGNFMHESAGMPPNIREGMTYGNSWREGITMDDYRAGEGAGYGWAQWSFGRHDNFVKNHLGGFRGPGQGSVREATNQDNYDYLLSEFRGKEPIDGIPQDDVVDATKWFRTKWERANEQLAHDSQRIQGAQQVFAKLQTGGMVPTLLEPGETVGTMEQWNNAIPRFQAGGSVHMGGQGTDILTNFFDKTNNMDPPGMIAPIINMNNMNGHSSSPVPSRSGSTPAPTLSDGPSMAALNDYINRVSWSSVF